MLVVIAYEYSHMRAYAHIFRFACKHGVALLCVCAVSRYIDIAEMRAYLSDVCIHIFMDTPHKHQACVLVSHTLKHSHTCDAMYVYLPNFGIANSNMI